ncbi:hypothetical protein QW180_04500 [Vibrio sinaloensis]|nr:hypothetical protein [Vibrio sinaloensis]
MLVNCPSQPNLLPEDNQVRGLFLFRVSILPTGINLPQSRVKAINWSKKTLSKQDCNK